MIEELRQCGYKVGPGTMYPLLHGLKQRLFTVQVNAHREPLSEGLWDYAVWPARAGLARQRAQELFGKMFSRRSIEQARK